MIGKTVCSLEATPRSSGFERVCLLDVTFVQQQQQQQLLRPRA